MARWRDACPPGDAIVTSSVRDDLPAVDVYGFMSGSLGIGQAARIYTRALSAAGVLVRTVDVTLRGDALVGTVPAASGHSEAAGARVNLVFVNPDHFHQLQPMLADADGRKAGYTIVVWFWELPAIPKSWRNAFAHVDEVWVASTFVRTAFTHGGGKQVVLIPPPVAPSRTAVCRRDRASVGAPEDAYVFLFVFDFNSVYARKNPGAVIDAFRQAFPDGHEHVRLVIKCSNGLRHRAQLRDLLRRAAEDNRVIVRDQQLDAGQMRVLHASCDAYVSLHRSEGFGLTLAEAMATGKPVIATNWSGNTDFMDAHNSLPIGYTLVPVADGQYPGDAGGSWAEPDVGEAAIAMRRLVQDRSLGPRLGRRARARLESEYSVQRIGHLMAERLANLGVQS